MSMNNDYQQLVQQVQELQEQVAYLTVTDTLTGVGNRQFMLNNLEKFFQQVNEGEMLGFLFMAIDFDNFKKIDDLYGYKIGDKLIKKIAQRLSAVTNSADIISRVSGTKFGVLHPINNRNTIEGWSQNILQTITEPYIIDNHTIDIQASIGLLCLPEDGKNSVEAINRVELAYYQAKKTSCCSNVLLYYPQLSQDNIKTLAIEKELKKALENDDIEAFYQPQFSLPDRKLRGFEALARWRHPTLGMIMPAEFIPVAEETGLIIEIGNQILKKACEQSVLWEKKNFQHKISINISIMQIRDSNFFDYVTNILQQTGINPHNIEFEITESIFMGNIQEEIFLLKKLQRLGISIALDDFGMGFSSLNYIKEIPLDILKIDKAFIKNIPHSQKDCAIAKTILTLAKELLVKVVAEGMEEEEQVLFLEKEECDSAQGFYFSHPLSTNDANELIDQHLVNCL